jgi:hypothetical protein
VKAETLFIPACTGTYADALEAIGTASLVRELGYSAVTIREDGGGFVVALKGTGPVAGGAPRQISPGYPYIWIRTKEPEPAGCSWVVDYEAEKEKRDRFRSWEQEKTKGKGRGKRTRKNFALEQQELPPPDPPIREFATAALLESMRKGWNGDRQLAQWIVAHSFQQGHSGQPDPGGRVKDMYRGRLRGNPHHQ